MKMKALKKFSSFVLALVMIMAMSISAVASEVGTPEEPAETQTGTITITNAVEKQTYAIYKIFALESYNAEANAYSYKVVPAWQDFVKGEGTAYVEVNERGYVTWKEGVEGAEKVAEFAKKALAYAKANNIDPTAEETVEEGNTTLTFSDIELGYYLVDSSMGTLCSLDTTKPEVDIVEKNEKPDLDKEVQDKDGEWGKENDESIGDTVTFRATITAQEGAQSYIMHDKMSAGLTFGEVTGVTLQKNGAAEVKTVDPKNYEVVKTPNDDCTFEVKFTQEFCDTLGAQDKIVVTYNAVLNENAVIGGTGNPNEAKLSYGEKNENETTPSTTVTRTYEFDLIKTTDANVLLAGAEFELYKVTGEGEDAVTETLNFVKNGNVYVKANDEDTDTVTTITSVANEKITIRGLENGTYYLKETKAPDGYNKLGEDVEVVINNANRNGEVITGENSDATYDPEGEGNQAVHVINKTGAELPSTGGIGTTIFYVVGGILVVAAAILLVVKKRMSHQR